MSRELQAAGGVGALDMELQEQGCRQGAGLCRHRDVGGGQAGFLGMRAGCCRQGGGGCR